MGYDLTFDAVDDLVGARLFNRLPHPKFGQSFSPHRIGPLIELAFHANESRVGPLASSPWLDDTTESEFRGLLAGKTNSWYDNARDIGFQRTVYDPELEEHAAIRTGFLVAAERAAMRAGFSKPVAQSLAAAIREMENNVHEHSQLSETGIMAFQCHGRAFEFVVADCGLGVLATLQEAPEYVALKDHGLALQETLKDGASRYGCTANRGMGFRDLFVGLATLNADLRFRSGDHALTIEGPHPELKTAQLAQKPFYHGFLASVRCELPQSRRMLH